MMPQITCWLALGAILLSATVQGQSYVPSAPRQQSCAELKPKCSSGEPGTISVAGRGLVEATADVAKIGLYVSVTNGTAEGARRSAAEQVTSVNNAIQQVNSVSPQNLNVSTSSVTVTPQRRYNSSSGDSVITGYTFSNYITVRLSNVTGEGVADVLDSAVRSATNISISNIAFSMSPALSYNRTVAARMQAAADAKSTAQQYAQALGVTLGAVLSVTDESYSSTPVQETTSTMTAALPASRTSASDTTSASTPVTIGVEEVAASIAVVYTICSTAL